MKLIKQVFGNERILGLCGEKNTGKTNNLVYLLSTIPKSKRQKVYFYGFPESVSQYLLKNGYKEIDSLNQLVGKTGCLIVIDEFQKLKLNDRRNKQVLNSVVDFIHHNKNRLILCSPAIREFNSVIGSVIDKWLLKTVLIDNCVNGSHLKKVIHDYSGKYKQLNNICTPKNEFIVINNQESLTVKCEYMSIGDSKHNDGIKDFF